MSDYYNKILDWVNSGKVELTQIISPPRTISTFFEISLSEAINGNQINEPFIKNSFEDGLKQIHDRLLYLGIPKNSESKPLKLVIKDIAKHLKNFDEYSDLVTHFVFLIRDPHVQMPSLITRLAHTVDGNSGGNYLNLEQAFKKVGEVDALLAKEGYSGTSWDKMKALHNKVKEVVGHNKIKTLSIVDATLLRERPEPILKELCSKIGFTYCNSMIFGSKKAGGKNFYYPNAINVEIDKQGVNQSAWIGDSITAEKYGQLEDGCYPLSYYTEGLKHHIGRAFSIYQSFVSEANIGPKNISEARFYFESKLKDYAVKLEDRVPTAAFVYYNTAAIDRPSQIKLFKLKVEHLKENHGNLYKDSFSYIKRRNVDDLIESSRGSFSQGK